MDNIQNDIKIKGENSKKPKPESKKGQEPKSLDQTENQDSESKLERLYKEKPKDKSTPRHDETNDKAKPKTDKQDKHLNNNNQPKEREKHLNLKENESNGPKLDKKERSRNSRNNATDDELEHDYAHPFHKRFHSLEDRKRVIFFLLKIFV